MIIISRVKRLRQVEVGLSSKYPSQKGWDGLNNPAISAATSQDAENVDKYGHLYSVTVITISGKAIAVSSSMNILLSPSGVCTPASKIF
jgi:hypothetical protein